MVVAGFYALCDFGFTIAVDERTPFQTVYFISQNHTKRNTQRQPYLFFLGAYAAAVYDLLHIGYIFFLSLEVFLQLLFYSGTYPLVCSFTVRKGEPVAEAESIIASLEVRRAGQKYPAEIIPVRLSEIYRINEHSKATSSIPAIQRWEV